MTRLHLILTHLIIFLLMISLLYEISTYKLIKDHTDNSFLTSTPSITKICEEHTHCYDVIDTNYYNGEILLPDYVHTDTLIVIDAKLMNYLMKYYDATSDGDINDILRVGTKPYSVNDLNQ